MRAVGWVAFANTAAMVVLGHFFLGYGLAGGSWSEAFAWVDSRGAVADGGPPLSPWGVPLYESLGEPAVVGAMLLIVGWPGLVALYWGLRPGGRQYR